MNEDFQRDSNISYGPVNAWLDFQKKILGFASEKKIIVITDIANFYDNISYEHLRNVLADLSISREHSLDLLIYQLSHMLWQPDYMPKVPIGLPQMNLNAPRLLAHCFLFEIDALLKSYKHADFARYMDDIDIGVDTIAQAKVILRDLDLSLQTRQIRLNSGKTQILTAAAAVKHFRLRENRFLDRLEIHLKMRKGLGFSIERECRFVERALKWGLQKKYFTNGNGVKMLKRLLGMARRHNCRLDSFVFAEILYGWPALRQTVLTWFQTCNFNLEHLEIMRDFIASAEIVDDSALVDMAVSIVNARCPASIAVEMIIKDMCKHIDTKGVWSLFSLLWIQSKYGTIQDIIQIEESKVEVWITQEGLARLVGALYPRFLRTPMFAKYEAIVRKTRNRWTLAVFEFHEGLSATTKGYTAVQAFVEAPNSSLPNKISHSKLLMMLSLRENATIAPAAYTKLKTVHSKAFRDEYYALL